MITDGQTNGRDTEEKENQPLNTSNTLARAHACAREAQELDPRLSQLAPWQLTFITQLQKVPNITLAARTANVSRDTAYKYRESNEAFQKLWDEALEGHSDEVEGSLYDVAVNGHERVLYGKDGEVKSVEKHRDVNAMKFWLSGNRPKTYRETHGPLININLPAVDQALDAALQNGSFREFLGKIDRNLTESSSDSRETR